MVSSLWNSGTNLYGFVFAVQVFQIEPGNFRQCDELVQSLRGRLEVLEAAVQKDGDVSFDTLFTEGEEATLILDSHVVQLSTGPADASRASQGVASLQSSLQNWQGVSGAGRASASTVAGSEGKLEKQHRCSSCAASFKDAAGHRAHFKSDWHRHNLRRKMRNMAPLSEQEWEADTSLEEMVNDMHEYSR